MNFLARGTIENISERFWSKVNKTETCWLWTAGIFQQGGYGQFCIRRGFPARAHRISWIMSYGNIPDGMDILHDCDNPLCVNPSHLWVGTPKENIRDAVKRGRLLPKIGEKNGASVLTEAIVRAIRMDAKNNMRPLELREKYKISSALLYTITHYISWKHVII
jgi:hypothetical protein